MDQLVINKILFGESEMVPYICSMNHLVYNAVQCSDCREILHSKFNHDFVKCSCENETFVDGGTEYCRLGGKDRNKVISLALYEDEPIELIREFMVWGKNYNAKKELLPKTEWVRIKDISDSHLDALIDYTKGKWPNNIFKREQEWRKNNY